MEPEQVQAILRKERSDHTGIGIKNVNDRLKIYFGPAYGITGYLADRMSVNLELPTADALRQIAPNKVRKNILSPMRQLQNGIRQSREFHGVSSMKSRMYLDTIKCHSISPLIKFLS